MCAKYKCDLVISLFLTTIQLAFVIIFGCVCLLYSAYLFACSINLFFVFLNYSLFIILYLNHFFIVVVVVETNKKKLINFMAFSLCFSCRCRMGIVQHWHILVYKMCCCTSCHGRTHIKSETSENGPMGRQRTGAYERSWKLQSTFKI